MTNEVKKLPQKKYRLIPAYQWHLHHDWPPPGGLRYLIFHADSNGFAKAIHRVGRRVLIDEEKFFECIKENSRADEKR